MRIKSFKFGSKKEKIAILALTFVAVIGIFAAVHHFNAPVQQQGGPESGGSGHSVKWKGFYGTYDNTYPDYYICINGLKENTLTMNMALKIVNQENRPFYFRIEQYQSPPVGWTIDPMDIGLIGTDQTLNFTYSGVKRDRPTSISGGLMMENVNLVVEAYYDSGYTSLYSQDNFLVRFNFIDRSSPVWITLYYDHFDNYLTTDGWSGVNAGYSETYYRSYSGSFKFAYYGSPWASKNFTVTGYSEAYLIFSLRKTSGTSGPEIAFDGATEYKLDVDAPADLWHQYTVRFPTGKTTALNINMTSGGDAYLDDVYIITK